MHLNDYQRQAGDAAPSVRGDLAATGVCALTCAAGAAASAVRARLNNGVDVDRHRSVVRRELGAVLGSVATLATASGIDLEDIASAHLGTLNDLYGFGRRRDWWADLPVFDDGCPAAERFPRRLVLDVHEHTDHHGRTVAQATVRCDHPPSSPGEVQSRDPGPAAGPLGDPLTDNARQADGYRFHDAIHLGFLAVLGWSPNLRSLLRRKRKSDPITDECEDGARAIFTEEGLAAVLARIAPAHHGFLTEDAVTSETIDLARAVTSGLEVHDLPGWLWRRAIAQGFHAMHQLRLNRGGRLTVDLDERSLTYQPQAELPGTVAGASSLAA